MSFGTIGNASCAEGLFWEAVNAVGVLQAPMVLSIWDDGYGISVPNELQVTKDLSELLAREPFLLGGGHQTSVTQKADSWKNAEMPTMFMSGVETRGRRLRSRREGRISACRGRSWRWRRPP